MSVRPYRIQADFDPVLGRVVRGAIFDCIEIEDPISGEFSAGETIRREANETTHPELFAALNAALNQTSTNTHLAAKRVEHAQAKAQAQAQAVANQVAQ